MEWGCMQALIDFDGWRKWKDFSQTKPADGDKKGLGANKPKSPKAVVNGKAQSTPKRDRMTSLGRVGSKENAGSDGTGTDTLSNGDSGSGNEAAVRG